MNWPVFLCIVFIEISQFRYVCHCLIYLPFLNKLMQIVTRVLNQTSIWHPVLHVNGDSCSTPLQFSSYSLILMWLSVTLSSLFSFSYRPRSVLASSITLMSCFGCWMSCQTLRVESQQSLCPSCRPVQCECVVPVQRLCPHCLSPR